MIFAPNFPAMLPADDAIKPGACLCCLCVVIHMGGTMNDFDLIAIIALAAIVTVAVLGLISVDGEE